MLARAINPAPPPRAEEHVISRRETHTITTPILLNGCTLPSGGDNFKRGDVNVWVTIFEIQNSQPPRSEQKNLSLSLSLFYHLSQNVMQNYSSHILPIL